LALSIGTGVSKVNVRLMHPKLSAIVLLTSGG
jgi:hypothetical protein